MCALVCEGDSKTASPELEIEPPNDYLDLLVFLSLRFVQGVTPESSDAEFVYVISRNAQCFDVYHHNINSMLSLCRQRQ